MFYILIGGSLSEGSPDRAAPMQTSAMSEVCYFKGPQIRDRKINKGGMRRTFGLTGYLGLRQLLSAPARGVARVRTGKSVR